MKKSKAISLLLSLSLLATAIVPGGMTMQAYAAPENHAAEEPGDQNEGMKISKKAEKNADGSYTITLEAYATGKKVITESKKDVPTDIVLVLDQSGSMTEKMNTYAFRPYTDKSNSDYYNLRHNGSRRPNLYHQLADGSYASVSVTTTRGESSYTYVQCGSNWKNDAFGSKDDYKKYKENLYVKGSDGSYQKVILKTENDPNSVFDDFIYVFPDDTKLNGGKWSDSPNFGDKGPLYYLTEVLGEETYTYTYTDQDGVTQTIGTSTGETTQPGFTLYERYESGSKTRLEALQTAVSGFADSVKTKAAGQDGQIGTADDVNHRVAVVGFATGSDGNKNSPAYENTEVFVGRSQYKYKEDAKTHYQEALQDMSTTEGYDNVVASKNALAASGATYPNFGLEMAKGILDANPVPEGTKRNRVVILFTDGTPGWSGYEEDVATLAVNQAKTLKDAGVTVYSVGIFDGADATSAGIASGANNSQANLFMQKVSSNNGTPQNPSYYLSAADADTLNNIFEQIADNIEDGGSDTTLNKETVIKDIISPQFKLPEGTTIDKITLETYSYVGKDKWENNNNALGATARITGDQVSVTGFDFSENWCGTETVNGSESYRGNKLVISFPVVVKDGFLGGNGVYTNTNAGVYEKEDAESPVFTFERPQVDVPIKDIKVTAEDKNVYLLGDLTGDQIKAGATVNVGNVALKLGDNNFGLQSWQNEYVNIEVTYQDKDGKTLTELKDLKEDTTYTVSVTVSPKSNGTATVQTGTANGQINVFKPELTCKDSRVYYGAIVPTDFTANKVSEVWKHANTTSTDPNVAMTGAEPTLDITYTPDGTKIQEGKINTKQDVPVKAGVKIGTEDVQQYTTFVHQACNPDCGWNETTLDGDPAFLLHVDTCQLTITKTGGADNEPYVFDVYKDGVKYSEVTIVGNSSETIYELPVGNYTIQEDAGWSWRYDGVIGDAVELSSTNTKGEITCTNTKNNNYWLNGFSGVVKNIFGNPNNTN